MNIQIKGLACPSCRAAIDQEKEAAKCGSCGEPYAMRNGAVVFLDSAFIGASQVQGHDGVNATVKAKVRAMLAPRHHSVYFDTMETSYANGAKLDGFMGSFDRNALVVNVGSLSKKLVGDGARIINLDISHYPNTDIVADAHQMPFLDNTLDGVIIKNVFEHIRDPIKVRNELLRVLKPGGRIFAKVPFMQPFHAVPDDYQRFSVNGLKEFFKDFEIIEEGIAVGSSSAISWMLMEYFAILFSFNTDRGYRISRRIGSYLFFWVKYLDVFLRNNPRAHMMASAFYLELRKPEAESMALKAAA